jgi:hypothetical protein
MLMAVSIEQYLERIGRTLEAHLGIRFSFLSRAPLASQKHSSLPHGMCRYFDAER